MSRRQSKTSRYHRLGSTPNPLECVIAADPTVLRNTANALKQAKFARPSANVFNARTTLPTPKQRLRPQGLFPVTVRRASAAKTTVNVTVLGKPVRRSANVSTVKTQSITKSSREGPQLRNPSG